MVIIMKEKEEFKEVSKAFVYEHRKRKESEQKEVKPKQEKVKVEQKYCVKPLIVQQVLIRKPFEIRLKALDKTLPSIRSDKISPKIPKTILLTPPSIRLKKLKKELHSKEREINILIPKSIKLDKVELKLRALNTSIETSKSEEIVETSTESSNELNIHEFSPSNLTKSVELGATKSKEYELEEIDFIEFLLGKGSSKILSGKPFCIIVETHPDKYEYIVATICREIYREKRGRNPPQPILVKTVEDFDFEFRADISDQIIIVENAKYSEVLKRVLSKLPFSSLGFLILVTDKPEELEVMIKKNIPTAEEFLVRVEPTKIDEKVKNKIIEFVKGSKLFKSYSFGEDFMKAVNDFEKRLMEYLNFSKAPKELKVVWHKLVAKSPDDSEQASEEHSAMKSFVWQYLWRKYSKVPHLEDERGVDVSIYNENYEIETFFGCGEPIAKLTEKMKKKFTRNDKIVFVLRNISILIHAKDLKTFRKTWRDLGYDVEIVGINFDKRNLIPIL